LRTVYELILRNPGISAAVVDAATIPAVRYREEILQLHLMHVIDRQSELFQQDNARPHTALVTMDYIEQNNINVLPGLFCGHLR
jgi:hypothetical protein